MAYSALPTRTSADPNAAADINQLQENITSIKDDVDVLQSLDVRQTVLSGQVDSNGYADFMTVTTNQVTLVANSTTPCVVTFADAFGASGNRDYISVIEQNHTVSAWDFSSASATTWYLYVDYSTTGYTFGTTQIKPIYGYVQPSAGSNGSHFFSVPQMKMYEDTGTSWTQKYRTFLGDYDVSTTTLSIYAIRGQYIGSNSTPSSANSEVSKNHNIGVDSEFIRMMCKAYCLSSSQGYNPGDIVDFVSANAVGNDNASISGDDKSMRVVVMTNVQATIGSTKNNTFSLVSNGNFELIFDAKRLF